MSQSNQDRRKGRVVDAPQQKRIVMGLTAVPMTVLLVAAVVMWVLTDSLFDEAQRNNVELPSLGLLAMTQFLFVIVTGAAAIIQALRYSHRVVGPAHRIAQSLRRIREGDTNFQVRLRDGDELQSILDELNPLIEKLEQERPTPESQDESGSQERAPATEPVSHEAD